MKKYSFAHLANQSVLREYDAIETQERADTAVALALLGEIDARRLFVPAGYPSMYAYCLQARHMSEDRACKRIRVARAARKFPAIYDAVADGRVHVTALYLLAPLMTATTVDGLLAAATHKTKTEVELLIAERAPKPNLPARVQAIEAAGVDDLSAARTRQNDLEAATACGPPPALGRVGPADSPILTVSMEPLPEPRPKLTPLSPQRFGVQFTMDQTTHDLLRDVQALLGPRVAPGDLMRVFALALECFKTKLEKQKFGETDRPARRRGSKNPRYVPDEIKRAVWKRDGGRCTFIGTGGKRCDARESLEFDHVAPVARGGRSTVAGVRLLCRAHNQYEAERAFGTDFMNGKRQEGQGRAAMARAGTAVGAELRPRSGAVTASDQDVPACPRAIGDPAAACSPPAGAP